MSIQDRSTQISNKEQYLSSHFASSKPSSLLRLRPTPAPIPLMPQTTKTMQEISSDKQLILSRLNNEKLMTLSTAASKTIKGRLKAFFLNHSPTEKGFSTISKIADHLSSYTQAQLLETTPLKVEDAISASKLLSKSDKKKRAIRQDIQTALAFSQHNELTKINVIQSLKKNLHAFVKGEIVNHAAADSKNIESLKRHIQQKAQVHFKEDISDNLPLAKFETLLQESLNQVTPRTLKIAKLYADNKTEIQANLKKKIASLAPKIIEKYILQGFDNQIQIKLMVSIDIKELLALNSVATTEPDTFRQMVNEMINPNKIDTKILEQSSKIKGNFKASLDYFLHAKTDTLLAQIQYDGLLKTVQRLKSEAIVHFTHNTAPSDLPKTIKIINQAIEKFDLPNLEKKIVKKNEIQILKKTLQEQTEKYSNYVLISSQSKPTEANEILQSILLENIKQTSFKYLSQKNTLNILKKHMNSTSIPSLNQSAINYDPVQALRVRVQTHSNTLIGNLFSKGFSRDQIIYQTKLQVLQLFFKDFKLINEFNVLSLKDFEDTVYTQCDEVENQILFVSQYKEGGYLKFAKQTPADRSLVRTPAGTFELLNKLSAPDINAIIKQFNLQKIPSSLNPKGGHSNLKPNPLQASQKIVLGEGSYGKARFARNIQNDAICVVKKIADQNQKRLLYTYKREKTESESVPLSPHLIQTLASTLVHTSATQAKGYLFMEYAGSGTAQDYISEVKQQRKMIKHKPLGPSSNTQNMKNQLHQQLKSFARSVVQGTIALHSNKLYHRDIKPENIFGNLDTGFKLGDYGLATPEKNNATFTGTPLYMPPEMHINEIKSKKQGVQILHSSEKHDSFSLGLTLLSISKGIKLQKLRRLPSKRLNAQHQQIPITVPVHFNKGSSHELCSGVQVAAPHTIPGTTLDEVIVKLLHADPNKRITPTQALALPYFQD